MEGSKNFLSIEPLSRSGKVYYLHGKPGKGGKFNLFFSTDENGPRVDVVPHGFEIYENIAGQVFLRRIPKKLIAVEELQLLQTALAAHAQEWRYRTDIKKNIITVHETEFVVERPPSSRQDTCFLLLSRNGDETVAA